MNILLIDNYDSFTYNVYQYLEELGCRTAVVRNDKITLDEIERINPDAVFLSPGPGTPSRAGVCIPLISRFAGKLSIFGVCLGHQAIGEAFGGIISHAKTLMHGKTSWIKPFPKGVMKQFNRPFIATRYHSLVIQPETKPDCLDITCQTDDGEIMGVVHRDYNIEGVQFHPESILTVEGKKMFSRFLNRTRKLNKKAGKKAVNPEFEKLYQLTHLSHISGKQLPGPAVQQKIEIIQKVHRMKIKDDIYTLFQKINQKYGGSNSFLLESAEGPKIDCTQTLIGLFPQFELKLTGQILKIDTAHTLWSEYLSQIMDNNYQKKDSGYDIRQDAFSKVFKLITSGINLEKKHKTSHSISCGLTGYFAYDYLHRLEQVPGKKPNFLNLPDIHLKFFPLLIQADYGKKEITIIENHVDYNSQHLFHELVSFINDKTPSSPVFESKEITTHPVTKAISNLTKDEFVTNVEKAKRYIYEGDIFQVQLGQRVSVESDIGSLELYEKVRQINPSPYMFYWDNNDYQLIGDSPELQLRVVDRQVMIRPIAGTSKGKGKDKASRKELLQNFKNDVKENAEHIMLVDLARNDIGRRAVPGSVRVNHLMDVEEFSHVFHLTSTVVGQLKKNDYTMDVFESTFPAGTLTGAPKIRAMEIISEFEKESRGPYGGAFGFFDFSGNIISSIIIRTAVKKGSQIYLQAAAGVVADSKPEDEWNETNFKMRALVKALEMHA